MKPIRFFLSVLIVMLGLSSLSVQAESLTDKQVETLLSSGFSSTELQAQVKAKGYTGAVDAETFQRLKKAGADADLILLLKSKGEAVAVPPNTDSKAASEKFAALKGKDMKLPLGKSVELELVWVPAGYWVGKFEVTQQEYEAVMGSNPAEFLGERRPVENVSWVDAMKFCKKVTEKARSAGWLPVDCKMTLPTEKQWEYFVGDATLQQAVYNRYTANGDKLGTSPVGSLAANRYGLYDVRGNVMEWCADSSDSTDDRVLRGGSWNAYDDEIAVSYRYGTGSANRYHDFGFRVVLVPVN